MMSKKLLGSLCLTVLLFLSASPIGFRNAEAAAVKIFVYDPEWEGNISTANIGSIFTIEIKIVNVDDLIGSQFSLQFNNTVLEVVEVAEGPFLSHQGSYPTELVVRKPGDPPWWTWNDTIYVSNSLVNPALEMAADGNGVLATVTFRVKAEGTTTLHFRQEAPYPSGFGPILIGWASPGMGEPPEIPHTTEDGFFISPAPKVFVDPNEVVRPDLPIGTGSFDVNISIANVNNLYNWSLGLRWSPEVLDYIGIVEGSFLNAEGIFTTSFPAPSLDQTAGLLNMRNWLVDGPSGGINGSGTLVTLTFLVEAKGLTELDIYDTKLFKSDGTSILHVHSDGLFSNENHDVAITNVEVAPTSVKVGENVTITVTASNEGEVKESFDVTVYYDDKTVGSSPVSELPAGNSSNLTFIWGTTNVAEGTYTITAKASRVPGEVNMDNNSNYSASTVTVSTGGTFELPWLLIIGGVALVAIVGIAGFFLYRRRAKS